MADAKSMSTKPPRLSDTAQGSFDEVIVEVGPEKQKFHLHKAFLVYYSEFFNKALAGPWKESGENAVSLKDVEPTVFNVFVEWLYTQRLPSSFESFEWEAFTRAKECQGPCKESMLTIKLYAFADRFLVPSLYVLLSRMITECDDGEPWVLYGVDEVVYAFQNLPSTDPILDFLVDSYFTSLTLTENYYEMERFKKLPPEFLFRFMIKVANYRNRHASLYNDKFEMNSCSYHEHGSASEKNRCSNKLVRNKKKVLVEREVKNTKIPEDATT